MAYIGTKLKPDAHQAFRELSAREGISMSKKLLQLALGALPTKRATRRAKVKGGAK